MQMSVGSTRASTPHCRGGGDVGTTLEEARIDREKLSKGSEENIWEEKVYFTTRFSTIIYTTIGLRDLLFYEEREREKKGVFCGSFFGRPAVL